MKKIIISIILLIFGNLWYFSNGIEINSNIGNYDFPYEEQNSNSIKDSLNQSKFGEIANTFADTNEIQAKQSPIAYWISKIINYFLVLLSFIAIIVLIYGFSLVFTDKTDEGVKKGYKYIKFATIAIIVIGVSWLISSWFFYIYNKAVVGG